MFVSGVTDSVAKVLGKRRGTNKERWISCETSGLIGERKRTTKNARDQTKIYQLLNFGIGYNNDIGRLTPCKMSTSKKRTTILHE